MQFDEAGTKQSMTERFAALSRVGTALLTERDEGCLLHLIAKTACELTGASFAAFSLRPLDESGQPLVPSEGSLFHLAAVVGVSKEQEERFRQTPMGGEGLLAPIFRHGVSVRIADFLTHVDQRHARPTRQDMEDARGLAASYAHGKLSSNHLRSLGVPAGHPIPRSFLGAPLLDLAGKVRGGLLLGHEQPGRFSEEDELLLVGLASQAAVALENGRLARASQMQAQELQAIFESSADGITLVGPDGSILRENHPARELRLRLEQETGSAQALEELLFSPARLALQTQAEQQQSVTLQRSQEEQQYVVTASPLRVPTPVPGIAAAVSEVASALVGSVVVWHDVTEIRRLLLERQRRTEVEARQALLQRILDELPTSAYLVHGHDAHLVLANRASVTVWGEVWRQGQPMQAFLSEHHIRIAQTDGRPMPFEHLATIRAVRHQETIQYHQEVIRRADGVSLPVIVNAVALDLHGLSLAGEDGWSGDAREREAAALVVHQDISALKEAERLKDEFISIAAHELRTPLAVLKGFAQTLLVQTARKHGPELAEWQMEALGGIDQATGRLVELVDDLLDVSRLQAGHFTLHPVPTDLVALTQRVVTRLQLTTDRHRLAFQSESEHLVAAVDPPRIEQVVTNLLTNAIKYSPEGGVIHIQLQLFSDQQDTHLQLRIQDQGIGIPRAQQAQIFGRFARAENARLYGIGGTGLGLYLCRELVEQHQGRIWFESSEGEGTTFFVTLPPFKDEQESD